MKKKIQEYLQKIEAEKNIKILLACETGSRAWGIASPDSDYDVRIIYVHQLDWYLSVNQPKDSIEIMLENNDLDITGWELKKALNLLKKSNAPLLERIQSPIIYQADEEFVQDIWNLGTQAYSRIATLHHYLSMAKKMNEAVRAEETYKLKKLFYALRTAIVSKWIVEKQAIPPIEFEKAYKNLDLAPSLVKRIDELIVFKATKDESYLHTGEADLKALIHQCIGEAEAVKNNLPTGKVATADLNQVLRKYIKKYDD